MVYSNTHKPASLLLLGSGLGLAIRRFLEVGITDSILRGAFVGRPWMAADDLHIGAAKKGRQKSKSYQREQEKLHEAALRLGSSSAPVQLPGRRRLLLEIPKNLSRSCTLHGLGTLLGAGRALIPRRTRST